MMRTSDLFVVVLLTSVAIICTANIIDGQHIYHSTHQDTSLSAVDGNTGNHSSPLEHIGQVAFVTDYSILSSSLLSQSPQQQPQSHTGLRDAHQVPVNATQLDIELTATTTASKTTSTSAPNTSITPRPDPLQAYFSQPQTLISSPQCTLGDDIYQIGERWNPNLPPFGVQVCVLCECTVRQRKSCYESKVTCRRITNECPVIDSCPDGKKPVTVPGQCCKSCQNASVTTTSPITVDVSKQIVRQSVDSQAPAHDSQLLVARSLDGAQRHQTIGQPIVMTPMRTVYTNERIKEYMGLVRSLPACPKRENEPRSPSPVGSSTTPQPGQISSAPKAPKGSRNGLNGIDTYLAFKSLHDSAPNQLGHPKPRLNSHNSSSSSSSNQQPPGTRRFPDQSSADDQQHPNDVQSASSNTNFRQNTPATGYNGHGRSQQESGSANSCALGNDTFQVGDMWNPIVPPFGVQVCVQCNCVFRIRKGCYATKVTCRRINRDCPMIDVCPGGKAPIHVDGQCCKTCPTSLGDDQEPFETTSDLTSPPANVMPMDGIQRNEMVYREFQALSRNLNVCVKLRESVDIYNTYKKSRSRQA